MGNFIFFILGIIFGMILLTLFCVAIVGAEAEEKIEKMQKGEKDDNKNTNTM